jgi:hypothetical protein
MLSTVIDKILLTMREHSDMLRRILKIISSLKESQNVSDRYRVPPP